MSLDALDTLDASLERAATHYRALSSLRQVTMTGRMFELIAADTSPRAMFPIWLDGLAGAARDLAADCPAPDAFGTAAPDLADTLLGLDRDFAVAMPMAEAFARAAAVVADLPAMTVTALEQALGGVRVGVDARDLPTGFALAAARVLASAERGAGLR